jgi:hypothetical protein
MTAISMMVVISVTRIEGLVSMVPIIKTNRNIRQVFDRVRRYELNG